MNLPKPNLVEKGLSALGFADAAARNLKARALLHIAGGQWEGARSHRTALKTFNPAAGSADSDTLGDLPALRSRSRDLDRNDAIARGARNTSKVNVVGTGLRMKAEVEADILGLSDEAAEAWETNTERLFHMWANSKFSDVTRQQTFYELQGLAFIAAWQSGDMFALRRYKEGASFIALCLSLIEADRVSTPADKTADENVRDGVRIDGDGEPVSYFVRNQHPGDDQFTLRQANADKYVEIPARGDAGPLIIHLFDRDRIGLTRGVPALAGVIEILKQLGRYSDAELMAAVVSAFFTVFLKSDAGNDDVLPSEATSVPLAGNEIAMGHGSVVEIGANESISTAQSNRPNPNFDPFWLALVRQIGIALGIPYEVLIMHFSSSYSASKAALEVATQFFLERRTWLARNFCQPVYEMFLHECVVRGIIDAPGFLDDPIKRAAWCGAEWIGPAQISIDPVKEAEADELLIDLGIETLESVTIKRNRGNWLHNQKQRGKEVAVREGLNLNETPAVPEKKPPPPAAKGKPDASA